MTKKQYLATVFYPTLSIYDIDWPQQNLLITWKSGAIFLKYDRKCQALRANAAACGYRLSVNIYRKGLNKVKCGYLVTVFWKIFHFSKTTLPNLRLRVRERERERERKRGRE